jgi:hypothetical protein
MLRVQYTRGRLAGSDYPKRIESVFADREAGRRY